MSSASHPSPASFLDVAWPEQDLETVPGCPYCAASEYRLAHEKVQDWSFGAAPGWWNYWACQQCQAVFLNPRPTAGTIGNAYGRYYTHASVQRSGLSARLKQRLRNEFWSHALGSSIGPRLGLPGWASPVLGLLKSRLAEPFGLRQLATLPRGRLIDVGCGNGDTLQLARQLGWQALGIELDGAAVQAARTRGLEVVQGGYEALAAYEGQADCVMCSHVLEHVHQPLALLRLLLAALKKDGVLLLSAPNASSYLREEYGDNWRGLEAPRHLAIADVTWLVQWLGAQGFECRQLPSWDVEMRTESERIRRRGATTLAADVQAAKKAMHERPGPPSAARQDIFQLVCIRSQA
ncbi:MAG: class I SAM-dependent methyltransferase [Polaromonas sp.]